PVWRELDDSEPPESALTAPTRGERSRCWRGQHAEYIDHIVLSRTLTTFFVPGSFAQQLYDAEDTPYRKQLSDHCPIALRLSPEVAQPAVSQHGAENGTPTAASLSIAVDTAPATSSATSASTAPPL